MWTHLLWKDARQVLPGVAICFAFTIIAQLLTRWRWIVLGNLDVPRGLAIVGPIIVVLACTSFLIGSEKQNRTLHWLSTLPIPWYRSLTSRFLVATLCTAITIAVSYAIATVGRPAVENKFGILEQHHLTWIVLVAIELLLLSTILLLIFEEPLYGLAGAGIFTILINSGAVYISQAALNESSVLRVNPDRLQVLFFFGFIILGLLAIGVIVTLYRWRWYLGQQIRFSNVWGLIIRPNEVTSASHMAPAIVHYPNRPFVTLLTQSIRHDSLSWFAFALAPWIAYGITSFTHPLAARETLAFISFFSILLLGITCFLADHYKQRFRFLSDRGVSIWKFYAARTIPNFLICLVMVAAVELYLARLSSRGDEAPMPIQYRFGYYVAALTIFFTGHLVGLCFRNVLIALMGAFNPIFIPLAFLGLATSFVGHGSELLSQFYNLYFQITLGIQCVWMVTVVVLALFWIVPQWLQRERSEIRLGIGYVISGIAIPCLLFVTATVGFYVKIPEPVWHDPKLLAIQANEGKPTWQVSSTMNGWLNEAYWNNATGLRSIVVERNASRIINEIGSMQKLQLEMERMLTDIEQATASSSEVELTSLTRLSSWPLDILSLAKTAILQSDRELFDQSILALLKLQEFNFVVDPASRILQQLSMVSMFESCSDDNLRWMLESQSLRTLLSDVATLDEYRQWSIARTIAYQEALKLPTLTPRAVRMFAQYRINYSFPFEKPANPLLYFPYALVNRFVLSSMSREFTAEIEAVDELIAMNTQALDGTTTFDDEQVYINARMRNGLPDVKQSSLSVNLSDFLRSREKLQALIHRIEAIQRGQ